MPAAIAPFIPLITAAAAVTSTGVGIEQSVKSGEAQDAQAAAAKAQQQQTLAAAQSQKDATTKAQVTGTEQQVPGLQSSTGGSLTESGEAGQLGSTLGIGDPNVLLNAINQAMGKSTTASPSSGTSAGSNFFPNAAVPAYDGLSGGNS